MDKTFDSDQLGCVITRRQLLYVAGALIIATVPWPAGADPAITPRISPGVAAPILDPSVTADLEQLLPGTKPELARRADVLLRQIGHGCGYYGMPRNYVTRIDINFFLRTLTDLIKDAVKNASDLAQIIVAAQNNQIEVRGYQTSIAHIQTNINDLTSSRDDAYKHAKDLKQLIDDMEPQIEAQRIVMLNAQNRFNAAVNAATNNGTCSLSDVLDIAGAILAVVASVYTAGASLPTFFAAAGSDATSIAAGTFTAGELMTTYKDFEAASNDMKDVSAKYTTLKNLIGAEPDAGRVIMLQSNLDSLSKTFDANVDSAVSSGLVDKDIALDFKTRAHAYFALVQARNKKILERDAWIVQAWSCDAKIQQSNVDLASVNNMMADTANPRLQEYAGIISRGLESTRDTLRQLLWWEKRSLNLWSLEGFSDSTGDSEDLSPIIGTKIEDLMELQDTLRSQLLKAEVLMPQPIQALETHTLVTKTLSSDDIAFFSKFRKLTFVVDLSDFKQSTSMACVMVTEVAISVDGIENFKGGIFHSGRQLFKKLDGKSTVEYTSPPLYILIQSGDAIPIGGLDADPVYDENGAAVPHDRSASYLGISPFSDWTIYADSSLTEDQLALATAIKMTFRGGFRAIPPSN